MISDDPKFSKTPIDVDSNATRTPITHKKIDMLDSSTWMECPISELYESLTTLQSRYFMAVDMKAPHIYHQINSHIEQLQAVIAYREQQRRAPK